eukprot:8510398-Pyramimonas_sp.AAC.1
MTLFYGSSCANDDKGALNTPDKNYILSPERRNNFRGDFGILGFFAVFAANSPVSPYEGFTPWCSRIP